MSVRISTTKAVRLTTSQLIPPQCLRNPRPLQPLLATTRKLTTKHPNHREPTKSEPIDPITLHRIEAERRAYYKRRSWYLSAGFVAGMIAIYVTATSYDLPQPSKLDSSKRADDPLVVLGRERKVIVQKLGEEPEERPDVVETGTSYVPTFPRVLEFADDGKEMEKLRDGAKAQNESLFDEYQLMGLGVRTVSFLGIQVYVVGMYVATDDIATVQQKLIRYITSTGSTLVAGEKEKLKAMLLDPEKGLEIWNDILKTSSVRTLVRIVPTRNTDFGHLRDAWVRHVTAKAQQEKGEYSDDAFGSAVAQFKQMFSRGTIPKGKELLLYRDQTGKLVAWYDDGKVGAQRLGQVEDERISRALWLNYLAGKTVASESARKNIIDGLMEFVERPVGTVATRIDLHV